MGIVQMGIFAKNLKKWAYLNGHIQYDHFCKWAYFFQMGIFCQICPRNNLWVQCYPYGEAQSAGFTDGMGWDGWDGMDGWMGRSSKVSFNLFHFKIY